MRPLCLPPRCVKIEDVILGNTSLARNAGYGVVNGKLFHSNNALSRTWDVASNKVTPTTYAWCTMRTSQNESIIVSSPFSGDWGVLQCHAAVLYL